MEKGDIIYFEYDTWAKENNKLIETTSEELAKKENIWDEKQKYGSVAVIVGVGELIKGLDSALLKAELGKDYELELPPSEAYGERDPKLVEIISLHEFRRQKLEPKVGLEVSIKNRLGIVTAVYAGRVRVDFNHRFAGRTIKYRYKILKKAEQEKEKVQGVIDAYYGTSKEFEVAVEDKEATIKLADSCKYDPRWVAVKYKIVSSLRDHVGLAKVRFVEEYVKKEEPKEEKKGAVAEKSI